MIVGFGGILGVGTSPGNGNKALTFCCNATGPFFVLFWRYYFYVI